MIVYPIWNIYRVDHKQRVKYLHVSMTSYIVLQIYAKLVFILFYYLQIRFGDIIEIELRHSFDITIHRQLKGGLVVVSITNPKGG